MIALAKPYTYSTPIRIHLCQLSDLPPEVQAALPELLHQLESHLDALDQQRAIQAAHVHRDDVRLNAALLVLNVLLFAVNAWLIGSVWARFG